jgi:hypothetical protein
LTVDCSVPLRAPDVWFAEVKGATSLGGSTPMEGSSDATTEAAASFIDTTTSNTINVDNAIDMSKIIAFSQSTRLSSNF